MPEAAAAAVITTLVALVEMVAAVPEAATVRQPDRSLERRIQEVAAVPVRVLDRAYLTPEGREAAE
tara:strand:- start:1253 stop:1450 length:198 start_codon:yes stop_codon:yes gene_type:complete